MTLCVFARLCGLCANFLREGSVASQRGPMISVIAIEPRKIIMRRKNWRIIAAGVFLGLAAIAFFFYMRSIAPKSNDPVALIQTVGTVSGVVGGLSAAMLLIGLIGKKV